MQKSIYLINPKPNVSSYFNSDVFVHQGLGSVGLVSDIAIPTVASLVPDDFLVDLCDEQISAVDFDHSADFIGITGKSSQADNMIKLAKSFRQQGKTIIIGGPYASLTPEAVRPYCDILVRGEIEAIATHLFNDLRHGEWQEEYMGGQPDLTLSPVPRWDLYPNDKVLQGSVQTSRGCPFSCEFCDVIQYVGRKQRHKSVQQVLDELDVLYRSGYRKILLADDNFAAYRERTKELLIGIRVWNESQTEGRVCFSTQLTIDTANEDEILNLCYDAGLTEVLIGIETPNEASLRETNKHQNIGGNLIEKIQRFLNYGISVMPSMVVGFDADDLDIFELQYEFAMSTSMPTFILSALVAPSSTPLYKRLKREGRLQLVNETGANATPWQTNIIPRQMTRDELFIGMRWLCNRLYHPHAFGERMLRFIDDLNPPGRPGRIQKTGAKLQNRELIFKAFTLVRRIAKLGADEARMFAMIMKKMREKPVTQTYVMSCLFQYMQIRHIYEKNHFWKPDLAEQDTPDFAKE